MPYKAALVLRKLKKIGFRVIRQSGLKQAGITIDDFRKI